MRRPRCSRLRPFLAALSTLVLGTGVGLEAWCASDRMQAGAGASFTPVSVGLAEAREHPSAAAYERLSRAQAAAGDASDAATSAVIASRLSPGNATRAATAEARVDAALRAQLRNAARPFAVGAGTLLVFLAIRAAKRRRRERERDVVLARARGRVVLAVDGAGSARGSDAVLAPGTLGLVIDVHVDPAIGALAGAPPIVVTLSNSDANRTVRLSPRRDCDGGAARFRVVGESLKALLAHPGRWRVLVRVDGALLAQGSVRVERAAVAAA